ncbi:MAG TPA: c-type cytochrome [Kofleriaceae bacterium]
MRGVIVLALLSACAVDAGDGTYLNDRDYRHQHLVDDLVEPSNDYSKLRLAKYAVDGGWDDLPEWNPAVSAGDAATALDLDSDLLSLGAAAFTRYPVQLWGVAPPGAYTVEVELDQTHVGATCATCHAPPGDPRMGLANASLDLGFGPGLVDVTTLDGSEPVKIPDLRPVRWEKYLQASGAMQQSDQTSLAIRIETLIITSHAEKIRPPRVVALALAEYLWSLAPTDPPPPAPAAFTSTCASCHGGEGLAGGLVDAARVGTDSVAAFSPNRGTGNYRVPSLRGAGDRALLLHDGSVRSLDSLLDPARTTPGHRFGTELSDADRAVIVAYVRTL